MGLVAAESGGGNFKRVPAGVHIGRCFSVIDLGTQTKTGQYGTKQQHTVRIAWELFGEDEQGQPLTTEDGGAGMPLTISKSYTVSLHEKAAMRKDLSAWRGRDFTEEEVKGFEITKLLGAYCMVNVTTSETNGKVYSNVTSITPLPAALRNAKPEPVHDLVVFDLDQPDVELLNTFHDKLKEAIKRSPEWAAFAERTGQRAMAHAGGHDDDDPSDIPF